MRRKSFSNDVLGMRMNQYSRDVNTANGVIAFPSQSFGKVRSENTPTNFVGEIGVKSSDKDNMSGGVLSIGAATREQILSSQRETALRRRKLQLQSGLIRRTECNRGLNIDSDPQRTPAIRNFSLQSNNFSTDRYAGSDIYSKNCSGDKSDIDNQHRDIHDSTALFYHQRDLVAETQERFEKNCVDENKGSFRITNPNNYTITNRCENENVKMMKIGQVATDQNELNYNNMSGKIHADSDNANSQIDRQRINSYSSNYAKDKKTLVQTKSYHKTNLDNQSHFQKKEINLQDINELAEKIEAAKTKTIHASGNNKNNHEKDHEENFPKSIPVDTNHNFEMNCGGRKEKLCLQLQSVDNVRNEGVCEENTRSRAFEIPMICFDEPEKMKEILTRPIPKYAGMVQCYIKRNKGIKNKLYPEYRLYMKNGDLFLMTSKKRAKKKTSNYLISIGRNDFQKNSTNIVGKLRSNFLGTEYRIFDSGRNPHKFDPFFDEKNDDDIRSEKGAVLYATNIMGNKGPRKMQVCINSVDEDGKCTKDWQHEAKGENMLHSFKNESKLESEHLLSFENRQPRWNEDMGAYVLNFNGRVTMASVKNFQLIRESDVDETPVLQFGRIAKDEFTMDLQWPMSLFQAFAISLSSFDSKLACD